MAVSEFPNIVDPQYIRAQVTLQGATGLPEDVTINTFSFVISDGADLTPLTTALQDFYDEFSSLLSHSVSRSDNVIKYYDWSLAQPAAPIATDSLTINAAAGGYQDFPEEVALCCSFQSTTLAGMPQARRRGRVYVGPWMFSAVSDFSRPGSGYITALVNAGTGLLAACPYDDVAYCWAILSRKNAGGWLIPGESGPPNLAAAVAPVRNGWVDNSWDTQRRRGLKPTSRTTF